MKQGNDFTFMRAVKCTSYGPPEVLKLAEVKRPQPKKKEVLIKIKATSVTASDVHIRSLNATGFFKLIVQLVFGFGKPRNPILGMVVSGIITDIGKKVTRFKVGEEVFGYCSLSPTQHRFGTYAEYICLPEDWNLACKPDNLSFVEAAAIPYGGLLASHLLRKMEIHPGDEVLIYGASGSIGTMLIQLAKNKGAIVTSVCSGRNFELVSTLGSDKIIDYTLGNAPLQLEQYKYVIDAVGNSKTSELKQASRIALTADGKYLSIDDGTPRTPKKAFLKLKELVEKGLLRPVIDSVYPMTEIVEAHRYVETGRKQGDVIISV